MHAAVVTWIAASLALAPLASAQQVLPDPGAPSQVPLFGVQENKLGESTPAQKALLDLGDPSQLPLFGAQQHKLWESTPAQQALPDLGDPSQAYLSAAQERKLGESIVRQIRSSGAYLNDPEVNGYLNELGNRLVTAIPGAPFDFEFFGVADPSINAFALPGGFIGVNTGLILLTQTESELASVLGHEITHVTQHHIARSIGNQRDAMLTTLAALAAAVLASRSHSSSGGQMTEAALASAQGLAIQSQIDFTRQNEEEADRLGFERAYAAGFDPSAMATFFERLQRTAAWFEGNSPSYFHDHPETYQRIAEAQARAFTKPFRQVPDSLDFQMVRALLKSYEGTPDEAVYFFRDAIAERKFNNEVAAHYGLVASLLRKEDFKARAEGTRRIGKVRAAASDDRGDGRTGARAVGPAQGRDRALPGGAGPLSAPNAAHLRLSRRAAQEQAGGEGRRIRGRAAAALPE